MRSAAKIDPLTRYRIAENGCWEWQGPRRKSGYGYAPSWTGETVVTRLFFKSHVGAIPEGAYICHSCDNPGCVNPAHLWAGSQADNMRDCKQKGRTSYGIEAGGRKGTRTGPRPSMQGERSPNAKLTVAQVRAIRRDTRRAREIGADHGVSKMTVNAIRRRTAWAWLED